MERQIKEPDQDSGKYKESRSDSSPPSSGMDKKTPVDFITLSSGMRLSDGPPPRPNHHDDTQKVSDPRQPPKPPLPKNSGTNNPFVSFMPLSTREREASLAISEDEISSAIDTFKPTEQPDIPRTISGSISNIIPPTVSRTKRRDATAKVKVPDHPIHRINAEDLVTIDSGAPPVKPLRSSQASLTRNLIVVAIVLLVFGVAGTAYMMLTMDAPIAPQGDLESTNNEASKDSPKSASISLPKNNETERLNVQETTNPKDEPPKGALSPNAEVAVSSGEGSTLNSIAPSKQTEAEEGSNSDEKNREESHPTRTGDDPNHLKEDTTPLTPSSTEEMVIIKLTGLPKDSAITVNGKTMDSPFEVPRSLKALKVVVNAPDYETAVKRIVPGQDKAVLVRMKHK